MPAAIETRGLTKYYGDHPGVLDVDLEVPAGSAFGFLGPNGAGKTTMIRLLLDLLRPTRGGATVLGSDSRRDAAGVHARLGYLPGELAHCEDLTAREHVRWLGRLRGGVADARMEELAGRLELSLDRRIGDLSRGNRQKVGLVQAFVHDPELLLLDEPTSGLDPIVQHTFHELVREVVAVGRIALGAASWLAVLAFGAIVELEVSAGDVLAATAGATLLSLFHGAAALLAGAITGRRGTAIAGGAVVFAGGYLLNVLAELSDSLAFAEDLSPYHHGVGVDPLRNGWPAGSFLLLTALAALATAAAGMAFGRRDIGTRRHRISVIELDDRAQDPQETFMSVRSIDAVERSVHNEWLTGFARELRADGQSRHAGWRA